MKKSCYLFFSIILSVNLNAQTTSIPDANFEQALIDLGLDSGPIDALVLTANISSVDSLNVALKSINFMTGIEDFTALTYLNCTNNSIYTLDVTQNLNLKYLLCGQNNLSALDVSQNTLLIDLFCDGNQLTALNVTQNNSLAKVLCSNNVITNLDITQNTNLTHLECLTNSITNLDVSQNPLLTFLTCNDNQLVGLNVQNGNNTNFTLFGATNNPNLTCIQVDNAAWSTANWTNIDATATFNTNCSVSINEQTRVVSVSIYPNPANDFITIAVNSTHYQQLTIEIIDFTGKIVFTQVLIKPLNTINITDLSKGYYSMFLKDDSGIVSTKKMIIN